MTSIGRAVTALVGAIEKVNAASPSWEELPTLLTEDEFRAFVVFISWKWATPPSKEVAA